MLGQVLVFALLLLPERAAGLAALSGLAFTRHPPEGKKKNRDLGQAGNISGSVLRSVADAAHRVKCDMAAQGSLIGHDGACLPFLQLRGGNQPGEVGGAALHSALPPVGILLVDDLDDVTGLELQARLFARDEVILGGVIVELSPHVHL